METTYTIENIFKELKSKAFNTRNFYMNEYYATKGETKRICLKIAHIFDKNTEWIYKNEYTDEFYLKYINKILKAYKKSKKYTDLLTY